MTIDRSSPESGRPTVSVSSVEVVEDVSVSMWHAGVVDPITVSSRSVVEMTRLGWTTRSVADIPDKIKNIELYIGQVLQNLSDFIAGVQSDNSIDTQDTSAYAAALTSRRLMDVEIDDLMAIVHTAYPSHRGDISPSTIQAVDQAGDTVEITHDPSQFPMTDPEGNIRAVDPQQAEHLSTVGWTPLGDLASIPPPEPPAPEESES